MPVENVKIYSAPEGQRKRAFRSSFFVIPLVLGSSVVIILNLRKKFDSPDRPEAFILAAILLVMLYGLYTAILWTVRLFTTAGSVTLTADRIIARNISRDYSEMKFDEIERIVKHRRYNTIVLEAQRKKIELSPEIIEFGACVEDIRARSVNVRHVDYGGLEKKPGEWS